MADERIRGTTVQSPAYARLMRQLAAVCAEMEKLGPPLRVVMHDDDEEGEW